MKKYQQILEHFGEEEQVAKTFEELDELREAIEEEDRQHIIEEFADVLNCMEYIKIMFNINIIDVLKVKKAKKTRTLERIRTGYYEKCQEQEIRNTKTA